MSMMAFALAAAIAPVSYDCTLDVPASLYRSDGKTEVNPIRLPPEFKWTFALKVTTSTSGVAAEVVWPNNPVQIAGKFPALSTAKGSIAFAAYSAGPCLFTESGCLALVQVVGQADGNAKIIVTPSAVGTDVGKDTRLPFLVVAEGTCLRKGPSQ